jgi:hypothetical protein
VHASGPASVPGAPRSAKPQLSTWTLADQFASDAVQNLDWYHAVEHRVDLGKVLLGEEERFPPYSPLLQDCAPSIGIDLRRRAARRVPNPLSPIAPAPQFFE